MLSGQDGQYVALCHMPKELRYQTCFPLLFTICMYRKLVMLSNRRVHKNYKGNHMCKNLETSRSQKDKKHLITNIRNKQMVDT